MLFGPIPLTHTSTGSVSIPLILEDGKNEIIIDVEGILFMSIPKETITFDVMMGQQPPISEEISKKIPTWIKNNTAWCANDLIDDGTFVTGIQFLIHERITSMYSVIHVEDSSIEGIPKWIKNNADWWSHGLISDDDFLKGIEFLIQNGTVSIDLQNVEKPLNIGGVDLAHASPILGSTNASVTIIEFGDYKCPKCQNWFLNTKPEIIANYLDTGKANLYFVDIAFLGNDSLPAAATYCAEEQGMFGNFMNTFIPTKEELTVDGQTTQICRHMLMFLD